MMAREAFDKLIKDYNFRTVLDIGSGAGLHSREFFNAGKTVAAIDMGKSIYHDRAGNNYDNVQLHHLNFYHETLSAHYDCVWASHVLEHQPSAGLFLGKCFDLTRGVFAVTVPPLKHNIVGGHVSLWNAGLLLYNMILAGFDCSEAAVKVYGYNISVIVKKKQVPQEVLDSLHSDAGDITRLQQFFPMKVDENFLGNSIKEINW